MSTKASNKDNLLHSYFSISMDLIQVDIKLPYNLFVNASSNEERLHFVRIFPKGETLQKIDIEEFCKKYPRLYVPEAEREEYLQSLVKSQTCTPEQKSEAIKDTAIKHLDNLFNKEFTTEVLNDAIEGCRSTVESMIEVINEFDIVQLQEHISKLFFHDFYTYDHSINVSMYCISIYKIINPSASREILLTAGLGGMLHDLGKINIPTHLLNKPGKLEPKEFKILQEHPDRGNTLLGNDDIQMPNEVDAEIVSKIILQHHENYDGTGYPNGISGSSIHILARITAIADFFDAITTKRSYHEPISIEEAVEAMRSTVNKKLDPNLFEVFASHIKKISNSVKTRKLSIDDSFDACRPYRELPLTVEEKPINNDTPEKKK